MISMRYSSDTLADRTFRASSAFELVLFDRLPDSERERLAELQRDSSFYGVLRPCVLVDDAAGASVGQRSIRAVDRETALLLLTMREPGRLPAYALRVDPAGQDVLALVFDGMLEVEHDGRFVSGRAAMELLMPQALPYRPFGRLARMSLDALEHAASLDINDRGALAFRMYAFGRLPLTPHWLRRFSNSDAVLLEITGGVPLGATGWQRASSASEHHWIRFERVRLNGNDTRSHRGAVCKLYVSPAPEVVRDAFHTVVAVLADSDVRHFKIGGDAAGLLRPDKIVVYFADLAAMTAVAHELETRLRGMSAQGVPFTAEVAGDGLISWGVDPPPESRPLSWQPVDSWRTWITGRLAGSLLEARRSAGAVPAAHFALERLRLDGVDVDRWVPSGTLWQQ